jgi:hypothetical protein
MGISRLRSALTATSVNRVIGGHDLIMLPEHIISLDVGHQTWARPIPTAVVAALLDQQPDILVLVEYVEGDGRPELRAALADADVHHAASAQV